MEPTYRYFVLPHDFSNYTAEPHSCGLCGNERPGYEGLFVATRGDDDIEYVCEECMAAGRLREIGASTNEGDHKALREQIAALHVDLSAEDQEALVAARTDELEHATPTAITWQVFFWPAHCGDYCRFLKEVGKPELNELAPDGDGLNFFRSHNEDAMDEEHAREVWEAVREDRPVNGKNAYSLGVFLFQCLTCGEYVIHWDTD